VGRVWPRHGHRGRPLNSVVSHLKMSVLVRRIILPFVAIAILWAALILVGSLSVEAIFGAGVSERMTPFSNVHLMEEALDGTYDPLSDWLFLAFRALVGLVAFGAGSAFAAVGAGGRQLAVAIIPALLGVALLASLLGYVWEEGYPHNMRMGLVVDLLMCAVGAAIGFAVGIRLKRPPG
jgi:hypothetical protein